MLIELNFYECEHDGDLEVYINDVVGSGGRITNRSINDEAEVGHLTVEVTDKKEFLEQFSKTESFEFSNYST